MKRRVLLIFILFLLVGGATTWKYWFPHPGGDHANGQIRLFGNVEIRDAQLAFNEQEHVVEVLVEEGDEVDSGQVLARLQADQLEDQLADMRAQLEAQRQVLCRLTNGTRQQELKQARAEIQAAQVRVANAERRVHRLQPLAERGASSQQALEDVQAELDVARAELRVRDEALELAEEGFRQEDIAAAQAMCEAFEARVRLLQKRIDDTILRSPARGIIQSRILEVGEMASPARPVFILALTDPKWVRAYLPEPQLGLIQQGKRARVWSDSFPDRPFEGRIGFLSPEAEFTPKSVQTTDLRTQLVYEVRVWVEDPRNELRLGMPVTVEIDPSPSSKTSAQKPDPVTQR